MPLDWSPLVQFVRANDHFLLMTHVRPDGDALGCELALADALRSLGKTVRTVIASKLPPRYEPLNASGQVERFREPGDNYRDARAIIIVDTGTWNQLGEFGPFMRSMDVPKLVIDHHRTQDDLGAIRLVDTSAEACGRLIVEAIDALGVSLSATSARMAFMGLAMDTGWFHHANTRADTFALADRLTRAGAAPHQQYAELYESDSLARMQLLGRVLSRLEIHAEGRVVLTAVYLSDYAATGAVPGDTEDMVNFTRGVSGGEVGAIVIEQPEGGVKVSFRCREGLNVARVAEQFGGGGHMLAAGATVNAPIADARARVLAAVLAMLTATE